MSLHVTFDKGDQQDARRRLQRVPDSDHPESPMRGSNTITSSPTCPSSPQARCSYPYQQPLRASGEDSAGQPLLVYSAWPIMTSLA